AAIQAKLVKIRLRNADGKIWLVPEKSANTKEPILMTVSDKGLRIERFDRPNEAKEFTKSKARGGFDEYLAGMKSKDQYVVFMVRPSGIGLFKELVDAARNAGFEVGFDALEEDREVHFTTPPPIDEPAVPSKPTAESNPSVPSSGTSAGSAERTSAA